MVTISIDNFQLTSGGFLPRPFQFETGDFCQKRAIESEISLFPLGIEATVYLFKPGIEIIADTFQLDAGDVSR